jgi:predicted dithiol-disulfide oxidoreductase (DUF899 family)
MVKMDIDTHKIVSQDEWLEARKGLLAREKEFTTRIEKGTVGRQGCPK